MERHSCSMMNMRADQHARLAAMREQWASIAAQPQVLWLSTAGAETSAPAETGLVPAEAQLEATEADLVPAGADQGPAEAQLVPAEADLVSARVRRVSQENSANLHQMLIFTQQAASLGLHNRVAGQQIQQAR
jgi:hypothetical protein